MKEKDSYFLIITDDKANRQGIGECGILKGLSFDDRNGYENKLTEVCKHIEQIDLLSTLDRWPSIQFGAEMALIDFHSRAPRILFPSRFTQGESGIPINGLIWMGEPVFMYKQIEKKLREKFTCIKLKIGAINWEAEWKLLKEIRNDFPSDIIDLRVDANGAFTKDEAPAKMEALAKLDIHSIEQPIQAGNWKAMAEVCLNSPLPVALDEELIGINGPRQRRELLDVIKPQYIIIKPSLLGGFSASKEWISLAKQRRIGWWVTSALESNIGLNAMAQWTYTLGNELPQGLGTGQLFSNNIPSPLLIKQGELFHNPLMNWDLRIFDEKE